MRDLLTAVVREDKESTADENSEGDLITMRISNLRRKADLKRVTVDGSREMLIEALNRKRRKNYQI